MLDAFRVSATASIGIAYGSTGAGSDEMLRNADLAMYTAKAGGKNCCACVRATRCTSRRSSGSTSKRTCAAPPNAAS